jgi:hypothetical protein
MDGIGATRSSTGQTVEISVDEAGVLSARTPDGVVLQTQPVDASRVKLRGDTLEWRRVSYVVDDQLEARRFVDSLESPRQPLRRVVAIGTVFVVGLAVGAFAALVVRARADRVGCDTAQSVVDASVDRITELNNTVEQQDQSFFAAVIVEQRTIVYAMDAAPRCFALSDRAANEGLLEGLRALLVVPSG